MAVRVKVYANIILGLVLSQGRATRLGMGSTCFKVINVDLQVHLHNLLARLGRPHRALVHVFQVEGQADPAVRIGECDPRPFVGGDLPSQQPGVKLSQLGGFGEFRVIAVT